MLNDVVRRAWDVAWHRRDTWWLVLWLGLLALAGTAALSALLVMANVPLSLAPTSPLSPVPPTAPPYALLGPGTGVGAVPFGVGGPHLTALFGVGGLLLLLGAALGVPFAAAGSYSVVARALRSAERMGPAAFWVEGWRHWGRGYGLALLGLVVLALAVLAAVILFAVLHLLGGLGVVLAVLGSVAAFLFALVWIYWGTAHLFMGRWTWRRAFGQGLADAWTYKWPSLGVLLVVGLVASLLTTLPAPLEQLWLPLGLVVAGALSGWVSLFVSAVALAFHPYGTRLR